MRYYGNASCDGCKACKMMMDKYHIPYVFIDVSTIPGFEGEIPQLEFDSGMMLIGAPAIMDWIRKNFGH